MVTGANSFGHQGFFPPFSFNSAWYAFQPGHHPVCQRHSLPIKDFGFLS
jgi:hypothetical protein